MIATFEEAYALGITQRNRKTHEYHFLLDVVQKKDFSGFLWFYDVNRIAAAGMLRPLMASSFIHVMFTETEQRELHMIPEVREFFSELFSRFPYLLYISNLSQHTTLPEIVRCLTRTIQTVKNDSIPDKFISHFDHDEMRTIVDKLLRGYHYLYMLLPDKSPDEWKCIQSNLEYFIEYGPRKL